MAGLCLATLNILRELWKYGIIQENYIAAVGEDVSFTVRFHFDTGFK